MRWKQGSTYSPGGHPSEAMMASATCAVVAGSPSGRRSPVRVFPVASTAATPCSSRSASEERPRCRSIKTAERIIAIGLARPCPAISGADPWVGSKTA